MNRRYENERDIREGQRFGRPQHDYSGERYSSGAGYGGTERYREGEADRYAEGQERARRLGRREEQGYGARRGGYAGGGGWPEQVWSGEGRFDEGGIGRAQYGYRSPEYGQRGPGRGGYGPGAQESRYREGEYGRDVYGQGPYEWSEYGEPRYVGSLNRGVRHGEEPYREHEWQRSKEQPGMLTRIFARGPKGYTRSDARINEDISEQLWRANYIDSSDVTVDVTGGVVTLSGSVPERWMRHEIENIADRCMGVQEIENAIRVPRRGREATGIETSGTRGTPVGASSGTASGTTTGSGAGARK